MANVNGIEVSGTTYNIEDETARNTASSASSVATQASNDVSALQTTVNNISDSVDIIADNLQTVEDNIGDLADLETTVKTSVVNAINEVNGKLISLRVENTGLGDLVTIEANSEYTINSAAISISADETVLGFSYFDIAYGSDAQYFTIKGIRVVKNSENNTAYGQFIIANISDSSRQVRANCTLLIGKLSNS